MKLILVLLKTDGGRGSAVVACKGLQQDPLFPSKVVLEQVQAVSWPFHGMFLAVEQWSVDKDVVINWMVGTLEQAPQITEELLEGKLQEVPMPPRSRPSSDLGDPAAFQVQKAASPTPVPPKQEEAPPLQPMMVRGR